MRGATRDQRIGAIELSTRGTLWTFTTQEYEVKEPYRGIVPGEYYALAVETLEDGAVWDPAFQEHVRDHGKAFAVREGDTLTLDLPLTQ